MVPSTPSSPRSHVTDRDCPNPRRFGILQDSRPRPCPARLVCQWAFVQLVTRHLVDAVAGGCGQGHAHALLLVSPPRAQAPLPASYRRRSIACTRHGDCQRQHKGEGNTLLLSPLTGRALVVVAVVRTVCST